MKIVLSIIRIIVGVLFISPVSIPSFGTCVDIGGSRAGTVSGIMNFCAQLTSFFLVTVFGKLIDASHGFSLPVYILVTSLLVCSFLWFVVDPSKPLAVDEEVTSAMVVPVLNPSVQV